METAWRTKSTVCARLCGNAATPCRRSRRWLFSRSIQTRAIALDCYRRAAAVLLYAAVDNEVATTLILEHALAAGRRVFYPVADVATGRLDFRAVAAPADLRPGHFGIPRTAWRAAPIEPGELRGAVVFVPGLAFGAARASGWAWGADITIVSWPRQGRR